MPISPRIPTLCATIFLVVALTLVARAPRVHAAGPSNLQLQAVPHLVDVGSNITFTLTAGSWPGPASVRLTFVSPHHGFSGTMTWVGSCGCFEVAVHLAPRIHPVETGQVTATVKSGASTSTARATFSIRGLSPDGRKLAPGGATILTAWVGDPTPAPQQVEHFCGWVTTTDGLGVSGVQVKFRVHFADAVRTWNAGKTGPSGLACTNRSIGNAPVGRRVRVDVTAGSLRATAFFTPRS